MIGVADAGVELLWGMRLTRKFIAALVIGVALVALVQGYLDYHREREVFDRQMQGEADALGRALGRGLADVWVRDGEAAAREFLNDATSKSEPAAGPLGVARRRRPRPRPAAGAAQRARAR